MEMNRVISSFGFPGVLLYAGIAFSAPFYNQINLVTDDQQALADEGFAPALTTDPNLINPWGISRGPGTFLWVSNQRTNTSTLYNGNGQAAPPVAPLVVSIPHSASPPFGPTGQVFNDTGGFALTTDGKSGNGVFFFANLDGSIAGWNPTGTATAATQVVSPSAPNGAIYTGLAI